MEKLALIYPENYSIHFKGIFQKLRGVSVPTRRNFYDYNIAILSILLLLLMPMSFSYSHAVTAATAANSENNTVEKGKYNSLASVTDFLGFLQNETRKKVTGAYIPQNMHLENMQQPNEQKDAISAFVEQGFDKYFFVMTDFENQTQVKLTEKLLDAADKATGLKIVIILLPPSEGGPISNYDWQGWVGYFNELKSRHPSSFDGFAIDDFNWISTRKDTKFWKNIDYMLFSNLSQALADKKDGVNFYPVVYFEGLGTDTVVMSMAGMQIL